MSGFEWSLTQFLLINLTSNTTLHEINTIFQHLQPPIRMSNHMIQLHHTYMSTSLNSNPSRFLYFQYNLELLSQNLKNMIQSSTNYFRTFNLFFQFQKPLDPNICNNFVSIICNQDLQKIQIHCSIIFIQMFYTLLTLNKWQTNIGTAYTLTTKFHSTTCTFNLMFLTILTIF